MITTLTANPSHDRTLTLDGPLERGEVMRAGAATVEPGGKGINVARVIALADRDVHAVLPSPPDDPMIAALRDLGLSTTTAPIAHAIRTNITIAEPDGTTTKINEPGPALDATSVRVLIDAVVNAGVGSSWVVLSGSLPPGAPDDLYAQIAARLVGSECRIAVDTSGDALAASLSDASTALPHLIKPNAEELADLLGEDADVLNNDPAKAADAARRTLRGNLDTVLLTLGSAGAVAVTPEGTWLATPPRVKARSTVGAGDSSLAGWLLAATAGHDTETCLQWAVAWGSAAVALPGSTLPRPDQANPDAVSVRRLPSP